jgi:hypothetical protein
MNLGDLVQYYGLKSASDIHQASTNIPNSSQPSGDQSQRSYVITNTNNATNNSNNFAEQTYGYATMAPTNQSFQSAPPSLGVASSSYVYSYRNQQFSSPYTSSQYFYPSTAMYSYPFQQQFQSPSSTPTLTSSSESVGPPSSMVGSSSYSLPAPNFSPRMPVPNFYPFSPHATVQTSTKSKSKSKKKKLKKANGPPKVNPNSVIEDVTYSCDSCEKTFHNKVQYETHLSTHIKCPFPECTFTACHRVIKLHKFVHSIPNYGKRETPEEIAKYIEERKRKYPTKANIQKKQEEMRKSGGRDRRRRQGVNMSRYRWHLQPRGPYRGGRYSRPPRPPATTNTNTNATAPTTSSGSTTPSAAVPSSSSVSETTAPLSQSSCASSSIPCSSSPSDAVSTAISARVSPSRSETTNGSTLPSTSHASEQNTPEPGDIHVSKEEYTRPPYERERRLFEGSLKRKRLCKFFVNGRCLKGERCTFLHDPRLQKRPRRGGGSYSFSSFPLSKESLLEKLLRSEMAHEHHVILQCLKYIVQNNFFQESQTSHSKESAIGIREGQSNESDYQQRSVEQQQIQGEQQQIQHEQQQIQNEQQQIQVEQQQIQTEQQIQGEQQIQVEQQQIQGEQQQIQVEQQQIQVEQQQIQVEQQQIQVEQQQTKSNVAHWYSEQIE